MLNLGDTFQNKSFDGVQRPLNITFELMNVGHLAEETFKSVLNNSKSYIEFNDRFLNISSTVHCENCKNYWLIKENKQQVNKPECKGSKKTLFQQEIKTKFSQKCK